MSNTSKGPANKGSKHCMQEIVNNENYKEMLDGKIGLGKIEWLSPLKQENYAEYKLNWQPIIERTGITDYSFWPANQPQWDAIGIAGDTLVLVEAKSRRGELISNWALVPLRVSRLLKQ